MWMPGGGVGRPAASADDVPDKVSRRSAVHDREELTAPFEQAETTELLRTPAGRSAVVALFAVVFGVAGHGDVTSNARQTRSTIAIGIAARR